MKSFKEFLVERSATRPELLRKVITGKRNLDAQQYKERMAGDSKWKETARASGHHGDVIRQLDLERGDSRRHKVNRPPKAKNLRYYLGGKRPLKKKTPSDDPFRIMMRMWKRNEKMAADIWRSWGLKESLRQDRSKDTRVLHVGRMTVPTSGHEENVNFAKELAKRLGASLSIVATRTFGDKKNPLPPSTKLKHLNRAFPDARIKMASKRLPTILAHATKASKSGVKNLVVVTGSDRVDSYNSLLNRYNGKLYDFRSINVVSSGQRKEGVSGTDMRKHAANNDFESFRKGLAPNLRNNPRHARQIFNDVRSRLKKGK